MSPEKRNILAQSLPIIARECYTSVEAINRRKTKRTEADARKIFYYLMYHQTDVYFSFQELGEFTDRTHASVINQIKKCKELLSVDRPFRNKLQRAKEALEKLPSLHVLKIPLNNIPQL